MVQVLLVYLTEDEYVINVNVYTDSQLVFEQVVHDVLEGGRSIAVTLLHYSSPVNAIWGRKCSILLLGGMNPNSVVAITDVYLGPEGVCSNCVSDDGLTRDECWLQLSFLISFDKVREVPWLAWIIHFGNDKHGTTGCVF